MTIVGAGVGSGGRGDTMTPDMKVIIEELLRQQRQLAQRRANRAVALVSVAVAARFEYPGRADYWRVALVARAGASAAPSATGRPRGMVALCGFN